MLSNAPVAMQQEETRETNQQPSTFRLSCPARLYSTVVQTMAPHVHADTNKRKMTPNRPPGQIDQSSLIIHVLKEGVGHSPEVFLSRMTELSSLSTCRH